MKPLSKRAAALLEQYPGPVTIRTSKWFYLLVLVTCAVALAAAFWPVWHTWPSLLRSNEAMVWTLVLLVILGVPLVTFIIVMSKGLPLLVLDANGLAFEAFVPFRRSWREAERFRSRIIYVGFIDSAQPRTTWEKVNFFGSRGRRLLFNIFALRSSELAPLLTAWRERALSGQ